MHTSVGVPLPFFFFVVARMERSVIRRSSIQAAMPFPDFALLHPGYGSCRQQKPGRIRVAGTMPRVHLSPRAGRA